MASSIHFGISEEKYRDDGLVIKLLSSPLVVHLLFFLTTTTTIETKIIWKLSWRFEWKRLSTNFIFDNTLDRFLVICNCLLQQLSILCIACVSMRINRFGKTASFHNSVQFNTSDMTFQPRPFCFTSAAGTYCTRYNWVQLFATWPAPTNKCLKQIVDNPCYANPIEYY